MIVINKIYDLNLEKINPNETLEKERRLLQWEGEWTLICIIHHSSRPGL